MGWLVTTWIVDARVVPEPSTLFHLGTLSDSFAGWHKTGWLLPPVWLARGVVVTFVLLIFVRCAAGQSWHRATILTIVLAPVLVVGTIGCSILYMDLFLR